MLDEIALGRSEREKNAAVVTKDRRISILKIISDRFVQSFENSLADEVENFRVTWPPGSLEVALRNDNNIVGYFH